jgi:hypothetical protein
LVIFGNNTTGKAAGFGAQAPQPGTKNQTTETLASVAHGKARGEAAPTFVLVGAFCE